MSREEQGQSQKTPTPKLSIVIDNYNYEQFVGPAIESVLDQNLQATEVIVVDDGSTDSSREQIDRYTDRVQIVYKDNGGQGSALNAGFATARGDWVMYLDADDLLIGDPLACLSALGSADVSRLTWQMQNVDQDGQPLGSLQPPKPPPCDDALELLLESGPLSFAFTPCSGNIWPRWFLKEVMPMPEPAYTHDADVYLIYLAVVYGRSRFFDTPLSAYRHHTNNYMAIKNAFEIRDLLRARMIDLSASVSEHLDRKQIEHNADQWSNKRWAELDEIEQAIRTTIPEGASMVLIDEGRLDAGDVLLDRQCQRLMDKGEPINGSPGVWEQVRASLDQGVAKGGAYLVVTKDASLWLNDEKGLPDQFGSAFELATDKPAVKIFRHRSVRA